MQIIVGLIALKYVYVHNIKYSVYKINTSLEEHVGGFKNYIKRKNMFVHIFVFKGSLLGR